MPYLYGLWRFPNTYLYVTKIRRKIVNTISLLPLPINGVLSIVLYTLFHIYAKCNVSFRGHYYIKCPYILTFFISTHPALIFFHLILVPILYLSIYYCYLFLIIIHKKISIKLICRWLLSYTSVVSCHISFLSCGYLANTSCLSFDWLRSIVSILSC